MSARTGTAAGIRLCLRILLVFALSLFVIPLLHSASTSNDQHLVLDDDDVEELKGYDPAEEKARSESLRDVEQRLDKIKQDSQELQRKAAEEEAALKQSQSALGEKETAASIVRRTVQVNQQRMDALSGLLGDLRQSRDQSAAVMERRLGLLYLTRLQEQSSTAPGNDRAALHRMAWSAAAHHAAFRMRESQDSALAADAELRRLRQTLEHQQSVASITQEDAQRLKAELAEAEQSLRAIEEQRREARERQTLLETRQEQLKDLLSLLEEKRRLQEQRRPASKPAARPNDADQRLVSGADPLPQPLPEAMPYQRQDALTTPPQITPLPAMPSAEENATEDVAVLERKPDQPAIEVQTDGAKPVFVLVGGQVKFAGELRGFGQIVILQHRDQHFSIYAHLGRLYVEEGEALDIGDVIGMSGRLAESKTGSGVRFEVRLNEEPIPPESWPLLPPNPAAALLYGRKVLEQ